MDSVARAIALLNEVASVDGPVRLHELAARLGWNKTTIFRLLWTLEELGAVREIEGRGYVVGPTMITLGEAAVRGLELRDVARPYLRRLHEAVGETVNLAVLNGSQVVIADRIEVRNILGLRVGIGSSLPAYCTSVGLVLLAGLDDEEVRRRFRGEKFERRGPKTIDSVPKLLKRLEQVRSLGYAVNDEELAAGHRAAAAPVFGYDGRVVAAINVSVPSARKTLEELIDELVPKLRDNAVEISRALGARSPAEGWGGQA